MNKKNIGVIGGSGYGGEELLSLISNHEYINLKAVSSREHKGKPISSVFNSFVNFDLVFVDPEDSVFLECEAVFFCTPHGVSMSMTKALLDAGIKIIDLSADFRIKDHDTWKKWYGTEHKEPDLIKDSVYGLVDIYAEEIKKANLVAVPGCYPTASLLGLAPILSKEVKNIIIDAKSGISGAGRSTVEGGMKKDIEENFKAYALHGHGHRHYPEIKQELARIANADIKLSFVPHLVPMMRGIYASMYVSTDTSNIDIGLFKDFYHSSKSIIIKKEVPDIASVVNTNECHISMFKTTTENQLLIISAIDNLVKGASGQAIQCFNLMFGLELDTSF